jgi:hypothetical protein
MKAFSWCGLALVALALSGCVTPVQFESSPPGAQVTYEKKGVVLGTTPFDMRIKDDFGWFSVYRFVATLDGYEPVVVEFAERTPLDAQQVIPPVVFKKPVVAVAQAASAPEKAE